MGFRLVNVFVKADIPIEKFASELESILEIRFNPDDMVQLGLNPEYYACVFRDQEAKWWFGLVNPLEEPYLDDGDKLFSHYNYQIEVGTLLTTPSEGDNETIRQTFARLIFEKLKALNKYPLMLVKDTHPKLDQFEPTSAQAE